MRNKLLVLILGFSVLLGPSASALTPQERKIIQAAQVQIEQAMVDYAATKSALTDAQQQAAEAEGHAAQTDKDAGVLKKQVDDAYAREKALALDNARMKPVYDECTSKWGLGAIFYGIKELVKHLFIAAIVVVILIVGIMVLSFFFPLIGVIFGAVIRGVSSVFRILPTLLTGMVNLAIFRSKSKPPPPASSTS